MQKRLKLGWVEKTGMTDEQVHESGDRSGLAQGRARVVMLYVAEFEHRKEAISMTTLERAEHDTKVMRIAKYHALERHLARIYDSESYHMREDLFDVSDKDDAAFPAARAEDENRSFEVRRDGSVAHTDWSP